MKPNPFTPPNSMLEQQSKRRSHMKLGVFCVLAISVTGLMAMLIQGCKRESEQSADNQDTNMTPVVDTNAVPMEASNPPVEAPPVTNVAPPVVVTPPPVVTPVAPAGTEYVVVKGDTLGKIAKKNGVTVRAIEEANPGVTPTRLKVGQKLTIPAGSATSTSASGAIAPMESAGGGETLYTVKSGDTLTKIAHAHGTTVK
ncbi:MAG TPA: LysM peptidoglycan-binding domain-containing protein, partial [Verrucomicrobiae bacterium]|nr:LysM peptidoglycan-binding domain-containing protein [Verrucomicrobiae bacterium]